MAGVDPGEHVARGLVVAVDAAVGDRRFHALHRLLGQPHQGAAALAAVEAEQGGEVLADRRGEVAGVAAAGAEAGVVALQHHHVGARLGHRQGRREAGVAGADHHAIAAHVSLQRWPGLGRRVEPEAWRVRVLTHRGRPDPSATPRTRIGGYHGVEPSIVW